MKERYTVFNGTELLEARLLDDHGGRRIELILTNPSGWQISTYSNGACIYSRATRIDGRSAMTDSDGNSYLSGCQLSYDRLGPQLREQIPREWHDVLGLWLASRSDK